MCVSAVAHGLSMAHLLHFLCSIASRTQLVAVISLLAAIPVGLQGQRTHFKQLCLVDGSFAGVWYALKCPQQIKSDLVYG